MTRKYWSYYGLAVVSAIALVGSDAARAEVYRCIVEQKFNGESTYTKALIRKYQPYVVVEDLGLSHSCPVLFLSHRKTGHL